MTTLYNRKNKLYDFKESENERSVMSRVNNGKPFKVYHIDGTVSIAYGFGEKQFTYDYVELLEKKAEFQATMEYNKERKKLMEKIKNLSNEELKKMLDNIA